MSRKIIIALSGWKQSGKSTVAGMLEESLREDFKYANNISSLKVESFATPFKRIIEDVFGVTESQVADKEAPLEETRFFYDELKSYRDLCIDFGEGMKEIAGKNIWVNTIERHILKFFKGKHQADCVFIIPDVRFISEIKLLERMKKRGFEVYHLCVLRKEAVPEWAMMGLRASDKKDLKIIKESYPDISHTEYEWCSMNPKVIGIINDGTLDELKASVQKNVLDRIWK